MTQAKLAEKIIDIVRWDEYEEAFDGVMSFLSVLKPKNINRFAKWGNPEEHSTPEKCWEFTAEESITDPTAQLQADKAELLNILKGLVSDVGNLIGEHDIEWQQAGYFESAKEVIQKMKQ